MTIPDQDSKARAEFLRAQFGPDGALEIAGRQVPGAGLQVLLDRRPLGSVEEMRFDGVQTKLGPALTSVREELAGLPVAGVCSSRTAPTPPIRPSAMRCSA